MSDKTDIKSMTLPELEVFTTEVLGEKRFCAKQFNDGCMCVWRIPSMK